MQADPLAQLNDVVVPQKRKLVATVYPMWALIGTIVLLLVFICRYFYLRQQHLRAKKHAVKLSTSAQSAQELHLILKRLVKHYYGEQYASLSAEPWLEFQAKVTKAALTRQELDSLYSPNPSATLQAKLITAIKTFNVKEKRYV